MPVASAAENGAVAAGDTPSGELSLLVPAGGCVRVVLADRDELYLDSVGRAVKRHSGHELVGTTSNGFTALGLIRTELPGVAVLDPSLPGLDGLGILNAIDRDELPTRVVMLTAEPEERRPYDALAAGARGYLTRQAGEREICAAITAAATGGAVIDRPLHPSLFAEIRRRTNPEESPLDPATREVIELTAQGLNPNEVAAQMQVSATTVKSRLQALYHRLGVRASTSAVAEAIRRHLID